MIGVRSENVTGAMVDVREYAAVIKGAERAKASRIRLRDLWPRSRLGPRKQEAAPGLR